STRGAQPPPEGGSGPDPQTPVLRINQLDAFELDSALDQLVWNQFSQCFQHFRPGLLTPVEPELKALLQLLLWRFTVYPNSATVGQSMMNLRYHNTLSLSQRYRALSRRQRLGLALLTIGPRWLTERSHSLLLSLGLGMGGSPPADGERILGIRAVFSKPQAVRDVAFQYMNRELLWHGFAEFLIFLLPLVNVRKIKTTMYSLLSPLGVGEGGEEGVREGSAVWKECGLCGEWPTMPHMVGCGHVFCYYCIKSHSIADAYLTCPKCGVEVGEAEPVKLQIEMTDIHAR
ncbi:unnamed protein product, partial [Coregonus sp. 'balchen']